MRIALMVLLVASLSVPVASAWSADILFKMDSPSKFVMEAEARIDGADAQELRTQMDQAGNDDGTVQAAEVETVEGFFLQFMNQADDGDGEETIGSAFTIDGKGASGFSFAKFDIQDAEGPITSQETLTAMIVAEMTFDVTAADNHTIRIMGSDNSDEDPDESEADFLEQVESAKMRAAPGYIFSSVEGLPQGAKVSGDKKEIEFASAVSAPSGETVIVMTRGGGGGSAPAPAGLIVFALLVGVAWSLRSRLERQ